MAEQLFTRISDVPAAPTVVTIGSFDGVHRGHQHILGCARGSASVHNARLLVVTFEPLPIEVIHPDSFPGRVVTASRRRELLFTHGADAIVELRFNSAMATVTAEEFMEELRRIGPVRELWVGTDFALGQHRLGTVNRLAEIMTPHGTRVYAVPRIDHLGREVSSTAVRTLILDGRAEEASEILGHRFQVTGEVIRGAQIGRTIGFPTANVVPPNDLVPLRDGIYATYARITGDEQVYQAMTYIGTRPAVNTGPRMIETHLFDFTADIYGQTLTTDFVAQLRHDANFPSVEALKAQLRRDEAMARRVLAGRSREPVSTAWRIEKGAAS